MSSIFVFGSSLKQRNTRIKGYLESTLNLKINENNPDLLFIEPEEGKKSIGIGRVKNLLTFASEKPMSNKSKAVVIEKGEVLTEQAQNSLLKILEEHPSYFHILIGAKNESNLLETVISRCKKIDLNLRIGNKDDSKIFETKERAESHVKTQDLLDMQIGNRLVWAVEQSENEKPTVIENLEKMALELRENLNLKNAKRIELILKVKKDLEDTNVTLKLALEYLAVKL